MEQPPKTKTVLLYGGSFNPPHPAHFDTAAYVHGLFQSDEVWMMCSVNRLKDPAVYAPTVHRMAMGTLLARHYPQTPFVMSDIEEKIGNNETFIVLSELRTRFPDHRFIWVMGADNLLHFHKWSRAEEIIQTFPMVVIERPPYTEQALVSPIARSFAHLKRDRVEDFDKTGPGWIFIPNPGAMTMSSSDLLKKLRDPRTDPDRDFPGPFRDVAAYIHDHGLYGLGGVRPPVIPGPAGP